MSSEDLEQVVVSRDDDDDFKEFQWLEDKVVFDTNRLLVLANEVGNLKLVQWLYARLMRLDETPCSYSLEQVVDAACSNNQQEVVKFFASRGHAPYSLDDALKGRHTDIVVCLVKQFGKSLRCSDTAAKFTNARLRILLHDQLGIEYDWMDLENAGKWGNMTMLTGVLDRYCKAEHYCMVLRDAILYNHLKATKFLYTHIKSNATWMNSTQVRNKFKDTMWLIGHSTGSFGDAQEFFLNSEEPGDIDFCSCIDRAIQQKQLRVVRFLHEKRVQGFSVYTMDYAALKGSLSILQFLHEHRSEGCTEEAMDYAVEAGFLHVVKFLYANYRDKCFLCTRMMNSAASMGHVGVVAFLFQNGIREIARKSLIDTAQNGHLKVIQFLFKHFEVLDASVVMEQACAEGHLAIVKWLVEHQFAQDWTQVLEVAKECEQEMVVAWLEQRVAAKRPKLS